MFLRFTVVNLMLILDDFTEILKTSYAEHHMAVRVAITRGGRAGGCLRHWAFGASGQPCWWAAAVQVAGACLLSG